MIKKMKKVGWKKLLGYSLVIVISLAVLGFIIIFGALLLLDQFDNRYEEPEAYQLNSWTDYSSI